jgi:branched-chain amino acid transport system permease protein/urea transport system permease protein
MQQVLVQGLNGLSLAGILILVALGLWFIFGVLGVINLAHGELFMLGAYAVVFIHNVTGSVWLGMVLAPLMIAVLGLGIEISVIKRLYERPFDTLLATWALSLIAREGVTLVTSGSYQGVPAPITGTIDIAGAGYPLYRIVLLVLGVIALVAAGTILYRTGLGLRARAVIFNREIAGSLGINVRLVDSVIFALGAALAGLAGGLMSPLITISPTMGLPFLALSFLVVILGGLARIWGLALGALILGGGQALVGFVTTPVLAQIAILALAIVVLRFRPRGLLA